jgi:uncharacterized protein
MARVLSLPPPRTRDVRVERDVAIPMRDEVRLLADLYTPAAGGPDATVLVRTPYGRRGPVGLLLGRAFAERGYRVVMQSCRGTFGSGGTFRPQFDDRTDGLDTIGWIERQPWFEGRLAMNGPSYMGGVQWAVADEAGPSLQVLCTHVAYSALARHWFGGGSFALGDAIEWTTMVSEQEGGLLVRARSALGFRRRRIDRMTNLLPLVDLDRRVVGRTVPNWRTIVEHADVDDPFWQPVDHSVRVKSTTARVLQVGGWYDIFLPLQIADYRSLVAAGKSPRLVVGPWTHTAPGGFSAQVNETLAWLDRHFGKGPGAESEEQEPVRLYVMGAKRWRTFEGWPPAGYTATPWHLHPGGRLDPAPPPPSAPDEYTYDPDDPTPIVGGTLLRRSGGRRVQSGTEARPDVLTFTSEVLRAPVEVVGEVHATIHVGCDLDSFDVFVRLCDVDARGRSFNVCDGIRRVSPIRRPRPPCGVWEVEVALWPTAQLFAAGHRIRVQVSSGAHPRFLRNLGTGEPIATATAVRPARISVHHDPEHPSAVSLSVG